MRLSRSPTRSDVRDFKRSIYRSTGNITYEDITLTAGTLTGDPFTIEEGSSRQVNTIPILRQNFSGLRRISQLGLTSASVQLQNRTMTTWEDFESTDTHETISGTELTVSATDFLTTGRFTLSVIEDIIDDDVDGEFRVHCQYVDGTTIYHLYLPFDIEAVVETSG